VLGFVEVGNGKDLHLQGWNDYITRITHFVGCLVAGKIKEFLVTIRLELRLL
jgi:hypothetical protein